MADVPIGAWEPDRSRFNAQTLSSVMNALPVADGWGPLPSIVEIQPSGAVAGVAAIPETVQSAVYVTTPTGTVRIFAFTAAKIYEFNQTDYGWDDVSRTTPAYASTGQWSIAPFGTHLYAQNGTDTEQYIELNAGTQFADNATAPIAKYIATVGDFLVRGNISGEVNKVQWSALNDPTSNDAGLDGSDFQVFPDGEEVMGIIPMSFGAIIPMQSAFHAMSFAPSSGYVFTFTPMTRQRGTTAPWSIVTLNQDDFILYCTDGFFRGAQFQPIGGERVDKWFFDNSDADAREEIQGLVDPVRHIVWFKYTSTDASSRMLGYNWQLDRWTHSDLAVQTIFRSKTLAVTIDGMDAYFPTIDDADEMIDSSIYDGGQPLTAAISPNGYLCYISGANTAAVFETNEMSLNGSSRAIVNGGRLDGDAVGVSVTLSVADYKGGSLTAKTAVTPSTRTRHISLRGDGRVHKVRLDVAAAAEWSIISGIELDAVGTGKS